MDFLDNPINLYIDFDLVDDSNIETSKSIYKQLTIGKLIALFYVESPFLGKDGEISNSLKILKHKSNNPTNLVDFVDKTCDDIDSASGDIIKILASFINQNLKPFKTWGGNSENSSRLGSHYITQIKVILQSKLGYSEKQVYKMSVRKALYEIIAYNELESGENILLTKKELQDIEDLKALQNK